MSDSDFQVARADLLTDAENHPIESVKVQTADRFYLHDFVTSALEPGGNGDRLSIYDGHRGPVIATYAPGAWISFEVLRFYRKGDDPPEGKT